MSRVLLTCHGYTGYSSEMEPLGLYFEANGFDWRNLILPGHESSPEDLKNTGWRDWTSYIANEVENAQRSYDEVIFAGLSLGGAMTLWVLENFNQVNFGIALAPPYQILKGHQKLLQYLPFLNFWIDKSEKDHLDVVESIGEEHMSYSKHHSSSVRELHTFVNHVTFNLYKVSSPLLIIHGRQDMVIPITDADRIYADLVNCDNKKLLKIDAGHVITREK